MAVPIFLPFWLSATVFAVTLNGPEPSSLDPVAARAVYARLMEERRSTKEPYAAFLTRWIAEANDAELTLLGVSPRPWTDRGGETRLYREFLGNYSSRNSLAEMLEPLQLALQRMPAMRAEAPWQGLLARAQLESGELDAALESARRAWALDQRLCDEACPALVATWLRSGSVAEPQNWPGIELPAVYNAASVECKSRPAPLGPKRLDWAIPVADLVESVRGPRARVAWLLRENWERVLRGCQGYAQWQLNDALEGEFPSFELAQAWANLQDDIDAWSIGGDTGTHLNFLGLALPLPAKECDFTADPTCQGEFKPLSRDGVRAMFENLRSASRHFSVPKVREAPSAFDQEPLSRQAQGAFRDAVTAISKLPSTGALTELRELLDDRKWAYMWSRRVPRKVAHLMAKLAREDGTLAAETLQLAQSWVARGSMSLRESASANDLLGQLLLRNGRPAEALELLQLAQQSVADLNRAQRISQLRSGLLGANLDATFARTQLPRPWIRGEHSSDAAVLASLPHDDSFGAGVRAIDVYYSLGGARAVSRRQLRLNWLPWLLHEYNSELIADLKSTYGEDELRQRLLTSIADLRLLPAPHLILDQIELPLPDQYCADYQCDDVRAVDQLWIRDRLKAVLETAGSNAGSDSSEQ